MKVKTSITLSEAVLAAIDAIAQPPVNRSVFLEAAAWAYIKQQQRAERIARDIKIINERADALNAETEDALTFQVPL